MGDIDAAIEKYDAFLAKPDSDTKGRQRATEAVAALRRAKASTIAAPANAGLVPPRPTAVSAAGAATAPAVEASGASSQIDAAAEPGLAVRGRFG